MSISNLSSYYPSLKTEQRTEANTPVEDELENGVWVDVPDSRKCTFSNTVKVVLIPKRAEYTSANLENLIWWSESDLKGFPRTSLNEIIQLWENRGPLRELLTENSVRKLEDLKERNPEITTIDFRSHQNIVKDLFSIAFQPDAEPVNNLK